MLILLAAPCQAASAQDGGGARVAGQNINAKQGGAQKKRPKVGLVLSGGGARGFAHIGALRVLEENRIPVDYIAGASMGALVGAMYAMGRTTAEMQELVGGLNWNDLLRGSPPYDELSFRRKEDRRNIPSPLTLRVRRGLSIPNSLNPGHEIGLLFDRLTLPYATVADFDDLPIPFRCVATDMVAAETIVLESGSLARALRATMAIPAVFAPVEIDGKILSDGGLLNNIPTDVVKAMGADVVIVVDIETQLSDRRALEDLAGVLGQTILVATVENSRRSLRQADLVIAPNLQAYTSADFDASGAIIDLGYRGTEPKGFLLQSLALDEAAWQQHLAARGARQRPRTQPVPAFVQVEGADAKAADVVAQKLGDRYEGRPLDQERLEEELTELTGTGRFDNIGYGLTRRQGETGLLIHINDPAERTDKPATLELGFEFNNIEADDVNFNVRARLTLFDVGRGGAEWRNDLTLGSTTLLATEYFRPLGDTKWFFAPSASYGRRTLDIFQNETRFAEYLQETTEGRIDFGYSFNRRSELRAGYLIGRLRGSRVIGDPLLPNLSGKVSAASLRWVYDGLDSAQIPTRGVAVQSSVNYYFDSPGASGGFPQAEARASAFRPFGRRNIVFTTGGGGTTFDDTAPPFQQFTLGGPLRVGGYGRGEFRASKYLQGGAGLLHQTFSLPRTLGGRFYVGGWYEGGSAFENFDAAIYRQSVTGGALMETRIGPVFVGGSLAEGGRGKFYFSLGRFF